MRDRRTRHRVLAALMAGVMIVTAGGFMSLDARAATRNDPRKEREELRRRKAELASQVDVLEGSQDEVTAALDTLNANVAGQQAALDGARRVAEQALRDAARAKAEADAAAKQLAEMHETVRRAAIQAYVTPTGNDAVTATLSSDDVNDAIRRQALLEFGTGRSADAIDKLRAAQEDLALKSAGAEEAARRAREEQASVEAQLRQLEAAQEQQRQLATQVNDRINHALSESAHLAELDRELSQKIASEQAALASRVGTSGSSGRSRVGSGNVKIVNVRGIWVNEQIADEVEALLEASARDGLRLHGSGYRDPEDQKRLRRAHCGSSDYAVYEAPSSSCSPPTAPPGSSMHEKGLAIDFTCSGQIIRSRSNPCYRWLARNASNYGLYNLPSEPWHWSTNGN